MGFSLRVSARRHPAQQRVVELADVSSASLLVVIAEAHAAHVIKPVRRAGKAGTGASKAHGK